MELADQSCSANPAWKGGPPGSGAELIGQPPAVAADSVNGSAAGRSNNQEIWSPDADHVTEACLSAHLDGLHRCLDEPMQASRSRSNPTES